MDRPSGQNDVRGDTLNLELMRHWSDIFPCHNCMYYDITRPRGYLIKKRRKKEGYLSDSPEQNCKLYDSRVPIHMHEKENAT